MQPKILAKAIFDRQWILFVYALVTLIASVQAMLTSSFMTGIAALGACALSFFGAATFSASFHARHIKNYSGKDLTGIGAIAFVLCTIGIALMVWSRFWMMIFSVHMQGWIWALIGIVAALLGAKKELAL
ncbi:MAG: hypothetical protein KGL11_06475 [Alphaproteobacteria bacterium]|nr:hypothetical protein [Alphaproteobacteria bacterium]